MDEAPSPFRFKKFLFNRALRILLITNGLILLASAMLGPIYALYVQKVGGDLLDASLAGSVFAFIAGLTVLLSGKYSDKLPQKKLIVVMGYVIIGLGFLLYTKVSSIKFLLLVQVIIGFGDAIYSAPFNTLYSEHLDEGKDGAEWGTWEALNYFSTATGALIGGLLVTNFGFAPLFIVMAAMCFSSAFYVYFLPKRVL